MRTPKEFTNNLKNGIITRDMLGECLFSVNKRAKNCRDQERSYRRSRWEYADSTMERYREQKECYYKMKDKFLSLLDPDCIHVEAQKDRVRFYDYEQEYYEVSQQYECVKTGEFFDRERYEDVQFVDVLIPAGDRYYLFYDFGKYSFHHPIETEELKAYENIEKIRINSLVTKGHCIDDLISTQFVRKMLKLIESGNYSITNESCIALEKVS